MKKEDMDLLMKDLCGRLPYGVKCKISYNSSVINDADATLYGIDKDGFLMFDEISGNHREFLCKPYLFPLSSMTKEQKKFFADKNIECDGWEIVSKEGSHYQSCYTDIEEWIEVIDWLNENYFDYRGLIKKGLAFDATGLRIYE